MSARDREETAASSGGSPRRRAALLLVGGWGLLVLTGIVVPVALFWERLPEPIAIHWELGGRPDGQMGRAWSTGLLGVLWLVMFGVGATLAGQPGPRHARAWLGAMLGSTGGLLLGVQGVTAWANLDQTSWQDARPLGWALALLLAGALLLGGAGWALARLLSGPDPQPAAPRVAKVRLDPDTRTVWASRLANPGLALISLGLIAAAPVLALLPMMTEPLAGVILGATLAVTGVLLVWFSAVGVTVDHAGVRVSLGPWGWPAWLIPLRTIRRAWAEDRHAMAYGGWGYRFHGNGTMVMIRSGPCLVLDRRFGEYAISVDDPERAAGLINALLDDGSADSGATG